MKTKEVVYAGIDLGTTYSSACVFDEKTGQLDIIKFGTKESIPSVVYISHDECLVGDAAMSKELGGYEIIREVKRFLGKKLVIPEPRTDHPEERENKIKEETIRNNFKNLVEMEDGMIGIKVVKRANRKKNYSEDIIHLRPEEVSALVLMRVKEEIQRKYGDVTIRAVVGIPAVFGDQHRLATLNAIKMANIELIDLVNEPTAAAKQYLEELMKKPEYIREKEERQKQIERARVDPEVPYPDNRNLFIYDFGGGTLDISIIDIDSEVPQVIGTYGNPLLGGNNLDFKIANWLEGELRRVLDEELALEDADIENILKTRKGVMKQRAQDLKIKLSTEYERNQLNAVATTGLEFLNSDIVNENDPGAEIELTYLKFLEINQKEFIECDQLMKNAMKRSKLQKDKIYKVVMVGGSCKCPQIKQMLIQYFGSDKVDQENTDFDMIVTKGLALYSKTTKTSVSAFGKRFGDVISKELSIELSDNEATMTEFIPIIESNSPIPISKEIFLESSYDFQTVFPIKVYQDGEEFFYFEVNRLPRVRKGHLVLKVTFEVKTDGLLHVFTEIVSPEIGRKTEVISEINPTIYNQNDEQMKERSEYIEKIFTLGKK